MDFLQDIWESLRSNKFRTSMTGFAIAWGIFILVVLLGVSNGLENGMMANYGSRLGNSVDIWGQWTSLPYKGFPRWRMILFTEKEADIIRKLPETELFSCVKTAWDKEVVFANQASQMTLTGVEADYHRIFRKNILAGRFINARDLQNKEKVAVLDERAIESLATIPEQIIGKSVRINGLAFRVIGVCAKGDRWEEATAFIPFSTMLYLYSPDRRFDKMSVTMQSGVRDIKTKVKTALAPSLQFDPNDPQAVGVWSLEEQVAQQNDIMAAIRLFILILGLCTLTSGAVGVSNIMLVSVRERTKELGIRKAIGAPPITIMRSVVGEALAITTLFGIIGMLLGMGIMKIVSNLIAQSGGNAAMLLVNPTVNTGSVLLALTILIIIGAVAGAIPAARAMRVKPIEAMNADK